MKKGLLSLLIVTLLVLTSCVSKDQVRKMLKEDPTILTDAVKANPYEFVEALNSAVRDAQKVQASKRQEKEAKELEKRFDDPLKPVFRKDESIRSGNRNSPIVLVEYSDFQCPFCVKGFATVLQLLKEHGTKIQFVYKHLPLSFHDQAMIASQYYEAIRLQSAKKAFKFHDEIYNQQPKLRNGEKFLKKLAKKVGANMRRLKKDLHSKLVIKRIQEDLEEAKKFGMQGTPGFILNGVPIKGAYPKSHFDKILSKLKEKGKLKF